MNSLTSNSTPKANPTIDLKNHDNFVINDQKIFPELVECAEHIVLACQNNPLFANKLINAEYDLLIWDDVSGRPVTLMIKYIIDHYRKFKWLEKNIKCIFIDDANKLWKKYIEAIQKRYKDKNLLFATECIYTWQTMNNIIYWLWIRWKIVDTFTQTIAKNSTYHKNLIYWVIRSYPKIFLKNTECFGGKQTLSEILWLFSGSYSKKWFASKWLPWSSNPNFALAYRHQIKLLSQYIIDNYLKN